MKKLLTVLAAALAALSMSAQAASHVGAAPATSGATKQQTKMGDCSTEFKATGKWSFNPRVPLVDANGHAQLSTRGRPEYAFNGERGREGQLIGRIGYGEPFVVGTQSTHTIGKGETGTLYLVINDDLYAIKQIPQKLQGGGIRGSQVDGFAALCFRFAITLSAAQRTGFTQ